MPYPTLLQQLALCAFLAVCSLSIPARQWLRSGAVGSGGSRHPEWATDPWIRRWIDEQEIKQRTTDKIRGADRLHPAPKVRLCTLLRWVYTVHQVQPIKCILGRSI